MARPRAVEGTVLRRPWSGVGWGGTVPTARRARLQRAPPARARRFRHLDEEDAYKLLSRKLFAINVSSRNVRNYRWSKQVLHVLARTYQDAQLLERTYYRLPAELRTNTVVLITQCSGVDWIW